MQRSRVLASLSIAVTMACGVLLLNLYGPFGQRPADEAREPAYSISGKLVAGDGKVPPNTWVRVSAQQGGTVRAVSVPVKPDGTFVAPDLAPGFYRLRASQRGEGGTAAERDLGSTTVTIDDRDVSGVMLTLR